MHRMKSITALIATITMTLVALPVAWGQAAETEQESTVPSAPTMRSADLNRLAVSILITAAGGAEAEQRANAVEALQLSPERALPVVHRALQDESAGVRYAAVVTAGVLKFHTLAQTIRPLKNDADPSVQAGAMFALHMIGEPIDLTPLAELLRRPDPALRGNVSFLLGQIGDPSAVNMLKRVASTPMQRVEIERESLVRIQMAEAVATLGDDDALDALRAGAYSQFGEVRALAITAVGAVEDRRMIPGLLSMLNADPPESAEIQLAAAGALARMGNPQGLTVAIERTREPHTAVRAQAAWVLGWFNDSVSMAWLERLMADSDPIVRVHAATSVLRRTEAPSALGRGRQGDSIRGGAG